jgi:hypothetical protein
LDAIEAHTRKERYVDKLEEIFAILDKNQDGFLTEETFSDALEFLQLKFDTDITFELFQVIDQGQNGRIKCLFFASNKVIVQEQVMYKFMSFFGVISKKVCFVFLSYTDFVDFVAEKNHDSISEQLRRAILLFVSEVQTDVYTDTEETMTVCNSFFSHLLN